MRNYVTSPSLQPKHSGFFTNTNSISLSRRLRTMLLTVRCIKIGAFNDFNMISRKMMDNVRLSKATISMKNIDGSHKHALLNNLVFYFSKFHVY